MAFQVENTLGGMQQREQSIEWPHPLNDIVKLMLMRSWTYSLVPRYWAHVLIRFSSRGGRSSYIARKYSTIEIVIAFDHSWHIFREDSLSYITYRGNLY